MGEVFVWVLGGLTLIAVIIACVKSVRDNNDNE